jgi:hypothetical protein
VTDTSGPVAEFIRFITLYRDNPVAFVREVLGVEPDPWQAELLQAITAGERRISVRSGHGVGKSTAVAWATLWFVATRYPAKIVVTAPTAPQLFDALFAEIKRWLRAMPPALRELFEEKAERIELRSAPSESFISARTSRADQPEALQGVHADHVMLVADEASGVPDSIFEAAAGSMSGHSAVTLLLGNPVRSSGFFYDTHHRLSATWKTFHVSCTNSPRVSADYVRDMAERYGENSNAFRIRVLGEFPLADDDTVIPMELIESATMRDITPNPDAPEVWGLDVARFGSDSSVLIRRKGFIVEDPLSWAGLDTMQTAGVVMNEYADAKRKPVEILVDVIGLGAGVVDRLRELGLPVRGINVSESPSSGQKYVNLRAELWFEVKNWLALRACRIPKVEKLVQELAVPRYKITSNGKMQVEPKDQVKKRIGRSPDFADALALTFASRAATLTHGWSQEGAWNKPLNFRVPGLV